MSQLNTDQVEQIINHQLEELNNFTSISLRRDELVASLDNPETMSKMELEKQIFLHYATRLKERPNLHHQFDSDKIPPGLWQPLTKLITALRVQELKDVKVIRRKGKYDIKSLRNTYFGSKILADLTELGSRWVLPESDYRKIELRCKKLNLELPTIIEPTTTEKFFDDNS